MLEKLFGRKATGVVNIICISLILIAVADYVFMFIFGYITSPVDLIGYAVYCALALAVLLLPRLLQRKFKLYVPTFIEVILSLYVVAYLLTDIFYQGRTGILERFLPALGGGIIAMTVFSVLYSLMLFRARKNGKAVSAVSASLLTFLTSVITVLIWHLIEFLVAVFAFKHSAAEINAFIVTSVYFHAGITIYCIVAFFLIKLDAADKYRIKSFKNAEAAKERALNSGDKGFYKVIVNVENDKTNYRKIFLSAKSKFLLGKVIYLALYAGYLVSLVITYYRERLLNLVLIISLVTAFGVSLLVSVYEYTLFRKNKVTGRLYKLKVLKSGLRILSLGLTFAMLLQADFVYNELTVITSIVMVVVNIITFINNIRKDSKLAATESYGKDGLDRFARGRSFEAAGSDAIPTAGSDTDDGSLPEV